MTDAVELKPCQGCQGKWLVTAQHDGWQVRCCKCDWRGPRRERYDEAQTAWNHRPIEDALRADNARLREALIGYGNMPLANFLTWVGERLVHVYGENPNVDFVLTLREHAAHVRQALSGSAPAQGEGTRPFMLEIRGRPELTALLKESVARFNAMSPEDQEAMLKAQRESWVRGEMGMAEASRAEAARSAPPKSGPVPPKAGEL